ncbi:NUDIX hydrolase [Actinomarinicola tropica]|uniref:NUDIX domain-containing protein n=1 Tax=Actinomarinicola tropica TaxID=2789776 RepID=A0A5Q2RF68_9ACTN|nr:NUDIX hydrolase [Actinomarinicola tropica]QGG94274.1 NUDIX domain-containing protein [Actinomarinicola tropica]
MSEAPTPVRPAATVVLLRDEPGGVETLMLRRSSKGAFGGMWVFPGGRVDDDDRTDDDPDDEVPARRAAVREAIEECALRLEPHELVPFSHWTPPPETPVRFATWFFVARASDGDVLVDGHEIHDHAWLSPREVMARRDRGEVDLAPPTFVTLHDLAEAGTVDEVIAMAAARRPIPRYETRFGRGGDVQVCMWHGDDGYDTADATVGGARHRLWMRPDGWVYERS